ncbi:MAG: non-canonical purine NTP pyrophosphatase [Actinomycetota bacterium]|nr:non-canonical purine NTP pyrophosphatase [Actinomycetota bacterium]MDP9107266.1 non-canonical purine NTP pyrophosphatase [Candidatus Eremiobacteraeota bacterium]
MTRGGRGATVYVATKNDGKLRELEAVFAGAGFALRTFDAYADPVEGDSSYADNAALKARALHAQLLAAGVSANVLADDSGLEVLALGGRPGVLTAYYGGADLPWSERRRKLLHELAAHRAGADRRARFVCALHFIEAGGREFAVLGTVDGEISPAEQGELGFSFDPVFFYPPAAQTFAELSAAEKNRVSHRAVAAAALLEALGRANVSP